MCRPVEIIHFACHCTIDSRDCQPIAYHPCRTAKGILKDLNTKGPFNFCTKPGIDPPDRSYATTLKVKGLKPYYGREPYFPLRCQEAMMHNECTRTVYASIADFAADAKMHLSYDYLEVLECLVQHQAQPVEEAPKEPSGNKIVQLAKKVLRKGVVIRDGHMQATVRRREQAAIAAANVDLRAQGLELVPGAAEREAEEKAGQEQREREELVVDAGRRAQKGREMLGEDTEKRERAAC